MRVGIVILPEDRWWAAEPKWRAAEEYGFAHAWTDDGDGPRTTADGPWFAAAPTLAAASQVTSAIRLGALGATPAHRSPVPFARELRTLDDLSDGRLALGVGPGEHPARFAEFVELLDRLLAHDRTTWRGEHYEAVGVSNAPGCVQRPRLPFVVAADTPGAMSVAARYGTGWATGGPATEDDDAWWAGVAALAGRFDESLAAIERHRASADRYLHLDGAPVYSLSSVARFQDAVGRARELGFTDVLTHWPGADGAYAGRESDLEEVAASVLPALAPGDDGPSPLR